MAVSEIGDSSIEFKALGSGGLRIKALVQGFRGSSLTFGVECLVCLVYIC